jgi:hypothetical protein
VTKPLPPRNVSNDRKYSKLAFWHFFFQRTKDKQNKAERKKQEKRQQVDFLI